MNDQSTVTATVAPGRTLHLGVNSDAPPTTGVNTPIPKAFGPGDKVELPISEFQRLRSLGYVV